MKEFKSRASGANNITSGTIGLTVNQAETLALLLAKEKLTDKQEETLAELKYKSENPELPQTLKTYCETWFKEQLYKRRKEFSNKYTEKGLIVEDNSIDFYAEEKGFAMLLKNEDSFEDDFFTGTPDIILPNMVVDIKSSWDAFTFPLFDDKVPDAYYWQAQVYMHLTGKHKFELAYILMDTPGHLIEKEAYYHCSNLGYDFDERTLNEFTDKMTFGKVENKLRMKTYQIEYDAEKIEFLKDRVLICRKYIKELLEKVNNI